MTRIEYLIQINKQIEDLKILINNNHFMHNTTLYAIRKINDVVVDYAIYGSEEQKPSNGRSNKEMYNEAIQKTSVYVYNPNQSK